MASVVVHGGAVLLCVLGIVVGSATRTIAAAAAGNGNGGPQQDDVMTASQRNSSPARLAAFNSLLAATRADLRTLFPNKEDLLRFVLTHRQALLRALAQQQDAAYDSSNNDIGDDDDVLRASFEQQPMAFYRPLPADASSFTTADAAAEQQQPVVMNVEPWKKRAQATYLRFGRSARLRFGKRAALPMSLDDIVLGETAHTAARRAARLRFG